MQEHIKILDKSKKMNIIKKQPLIFWGISKQKKYGILQGRS